MTNDPRENPGRSVPDRHITLPLAHASPRCGARTRGGASCKGPERRRTGGAGCTAAHRPTHARRRACSGSWRHARRMAPMGGDARSAQADAGTTRGTAARAEVAGLVDERQLSPAGRRATLSPPDGELNLLIGAARRRRPLCAQLDCLTLHQKISEPDIQDRVETRWVSFPRGLGARANASHGVRSEQTIHYCRAIPARPPRSMNFCTLPVAVFGSWSTKLTHCGVLKWARLLRT